MNNSTAPNFRKLTGYRKHIYVRETAREKYYFVKYILKPTSTPCILCHKAEALFQRFGDDYRIKEKDFNCSDTFVNKSKSFSWLEAFSLCRSINATLPEFYSRKEQEEFIAVLKSGNIFPIEALYIGLHKQLQVGK